MTKNLTNCYLQSLPSRGDGGSPLKFLVSSASNKCGPGRLRLGGWGIDRDRARPATCYQARSPTGLL